MMYFYVFLCKVMVKDMSIAVTWICRSCSMYFWPFVKQNQAENLIQCFSVDFHWIRSIADVGGHQMFFSALFVITGSVHFFLKPIKCLPQQEAPSEGHGINKVGENSIWISTVISCKIFPSSNFGIKVSRAKYFDDQNIQQYLLQNLPQKGNPSCFTTLVGESWLFSFK